MIRNRFISLFLASAAIFSAFISLNSCSHAKQPESEILTDVFRETAVSLPDDISLINSVDPYYDIDTDSFRFLCESGNSLIVMTLGNDLAVTTATIIEDVTSEDSPIALFTDYIGSGALGKSTLTSFLSVRDAETEARTYTVFTYNYSTGEVYSAAEIEKRMIYSDPSLRITDLAVDSDGFIYCANENEILAFSPDYSSNFSVFSYNYITDIAAMCGTVYADGYWNARSCFRPIITASGDLGDTVPVPASADHLIHGSGYDYFYSDSTGIWGKNADSDAELIMNYQNSGFTAESVTPLYVYDSDRILLIEGNSLKLCTRSDDIDLANVITIEVAYIDDPGSILSHIAAFNRNNPGVRVIAKDYRSGSLSYDAAVEKLTIDIITGVYKPDIVTNSDISDTFIEIYRNGLYTDLYPLIEATDYCTKDDLLGCFKRTFETPDGELWAFGEDLRIDTIAAKTSIVGERDRWTLTDMLELEKTLADDQYLYQLASQDGFSSYLLGSNGYSFFIDEENNTCDFTGEDFMMLLDYAESLPETYEELKALTEHLYSEDDGYLGFKTDNFILHPTSIFSPSFWLTTGAAFGTDDITLIGYPSDGVYNGSAINMCPYVITSYCEHPDKAWDFIAQTLLDEEINYQWCLPITRSQLVTDLEKMKEYCYDVSPNGHGISSSLIELADMNPVSPGYTRKFMTDEIIAEFLNFVDNVAGYPIEVSADDTINDIIDEELSRFLAGVQTKEECAAIIQSRVNIYLSEKE